MEPNRPVLMGVIGAPHGVRGWLRVSPYTATPEGVFEYKTWTLGNHAVSLANWKRHGRRWIVKLQGVDTPERAAELTGLGIHVQASALPALDEGEYYWSELLGARVNTLDNQWLGEISSMLETASNDVMVVKPCPGSLDARERLIPYIQGQVVKSVERDTPERIGQLEAPAEQQARAVTQVWVDWDVDF